MKNTSHLVLLASVLMLPSCALGVAAGVGAAAGVAASQEGGLSTAASDTAIQARINHLWFQHDTNMFVKLDLTINQGVVLITGVVQNPQHRVEAVRLAWQVSGVKQVNNEIKVAESDGIVGYAKDTWITTRLRSAILIDRDIESLNYSIDTVQGTVYLMGFAQDQQELDRVIEKARTIENVRQVVSYVKLVGTPEEPAGQKPYAGDESGYQGQPAQDGFGQQDQQGYGGNLNQDDFAQPADSYGSNGGGAAVAPVATGEPIEWNAAPADMR